MNLYYRIMFISLFLSNSILLASGNSRKHDVDVWSLARKAIEEYELRGQLTTAVIKRDFDQVRAIIPKLSDHDFRGSLDNSKEYPLLEIATCLLVRGFENDHQKAQKEKDLELKVIEELLKNKANVNAYVEMPPLNWAVSNYREDIVELLLKYGANKNLKDFRGQTATEILASRNYLNEYRSESELAVLRKIMDLLNNKVNLISRN